MQDLYPSKDRSPWAAMREVAAVVARVFRHLWQVSPALFAIQCAFLVTSALIPAAIIWMTKVIIDAVVAASGADWTAITVPLAVIAGLWFLQALCDALSSYTRSLFDEMVYYSAYRSLLAKAASLDIAFYETPRFYDRLHFANQQTYRMSGLSFACLNLIREICSMAAMVGLLSVLHPLAVVVLLATSLPRILMEGRIARGRYELDMELTRNDRLIEYVKRLLTNRDSAKEVRLFRLPGPLLARFEEYRRTYIDRLMRYLRRVLGLNAAFNSLSLLGILSIWVYAAYQAVMENITIGDLALVFQTAQRTTQIIEGLIRSGGMVYENSLFATRFFDLLDLDPQSVEGALAPPRVSPALRFPTAPKRGFEFQNVSFQYPASDKRILTEVSFTLDVGQKLAIVGENGAGKTTLVKLICRLYDPTLGRILFDGRDLRDYDAVDWHRNVGVVFQDFHRYDMTASDNIGIGRVEAMSDAAAVRAAAAKAGADVIVEALPQGFETMLGRTLDEGVDLSGGEWQHMAIARAIMSDARILVLDEPTAAVDALREHALYETLSDLEDDRMMVFISHRFSTVRMADAIVVFEDGALTEAGDHDELMARGGKYAKMFSTQAARYR